MQLFKNKLFFLGRVRNSSFFDSWLVRRLFDIEETRQKRRLATRRRIAAHGPAEVARLLGVSSGWVRDHATRKTPRIPVVRIGRLMRFRPADIKVIVQYGFTSENWRANGEQF